MSRVRYIHRRVAHKKNTARAHSKQASQSFFDFGSEQSFFSGNTKEAAIHRQNDASEKEKDNQKLQRIDSASSAHTAPVNVASYVKSLNGKGSALPGQTRQFFEPKFGVDFSKVRVHNDQDSAEMASSIHAKAFTHKNHIVFNKGQYDTDSAKGKQLLTHELTHVMQQDNAIKRTEIEHHDEEKLQRAPSPHSDFVIRGVYPGAASVPDTIYFDFASAHIPSSEDWKLPNLAKPAKKDLTLTGMVSEEGDSTFNTNLLTNRMKSVSKALRNKGLEKDPTPNPQQAASTGQIDYRRQRAVEVIPTPPTVPPTGVPPIHTPDCSSGTFDVTPAENAFASAYAKAMPWMLKAMLEVSNATPAAVAQVSTLFKGKTVADILPHITNLLAKMMMLPAQHECHSTCDAGCSRPAYYNPGLDKIVLCPDFTSADPDFQAYLLIHESLHGTTGLHTVDTAYSFTRLILSLTGPQAMQNTDSFVLLILNLGGAPTANYIPPLDTFPGLSPDEEDKAKKAITFLEQWLDKSEFDSSLLYDAIDKNIGNAGGWATSYDWHAGLIHQIRTFFGLTDPGSSTPYPTPPVNADKWIMAGVYDRYTQMNNCIYRSPITFMKASTGAGQWAPNLGNSVTLGTTFFDPTLSLTDRVIYLFRLMIESIPGQIPSSRKNAYISAADAIRNNRGVGP